MPAAPLPSQLPADAPGQEAGGPGTQGAYYSRGSSGFLASF